MMIFNFYFINIYFYRFYKNSLNYKIMRVNTLIKITLFILFNKYILSLNIIKIKNYFFNYENNHKQKKYIVSFKNNKTYSNSKTDLFIHENLFIKNKELITISPGGIRGFYLLGILSYIKSNYKTDNLIYSGASAGAWNSLFMCYKGDTLEFVYDLLNSDINKSRNLNEIQYFMKYRILKKYKNEDFELNKLFIGVTTFSNFKIISNIFTNFNSLEDAINCCMASSHIPFITGGLTHKYNNMFTFDGGFSNNPYLDKKSLLHISPVIWNKIEKKPLILNNIFIFKHFFSVKSNNLLRLYDDGYQDAKNNKKYLDKVFEDNDENPIMF